MSNDMPELKPCPFCGGTDIEMFAFSIDPECRLSCKCGAGVEANIPWGDMTEAEHDIECCRVLSEMWNTRDFDRTPIREHAEEAVALLMEMKWEVARLHNENGSIAAKYHNLFKYLATIEAEQRREEEDDGLQ